MTDDVGRLWTIAGGLLVIDAPAVAQVAYLFFVAAFAVIHRMECGQWPGF